MRLVFAVAALLSATAPVIVAAQTEQAVANAVSVRRGQLVFDTNNTRLGAIDSVASDGTIGLVVNAKYVRLPVGSFSLVDGKIISQKTKKELR